MGAYHEEDTAYKLRRSSVLICDCNRPSPLQHNIRYINATGSDKAMSGQCYKWFFFLNYVTYKFTLLW